MKKTEIIANATISVDDTTLLDCIIRLKESDKALSIDGALDVSKSSHLKDFHEVKTFKLTKYDGEFERVFNGVITDYQADRVYLDCQTVTIKVTLVNAG